MMQAAQLDIFGGETVSAPQRTNDQTPKSTPTVVQGSLFEVTRAVPGRTRSIVYTEPELTDLI